jgi:Skp family chaperone for outer membrane proteins
MLSPRRLAATAALLGALAAGALALLVLADLITFGAAAATAAFALALAALVLLLLTVRRVDGKAHRIDLRIKKHEAELARTTTALKNIESRLDLLVQAVEDSAARRADDLGAILASLGEDRVNAMSRAREVEELREEVRSPDKGPA